MEILLRVYLGSFDIEINVQDTDVSVRYDVTLNQENLTNKNLSIKSVKETQVSNTLYQTGENTYTAIIPLSEIQKGNTVNKITVEVEWKDDGTNPDYDGKKRLIPFGLKSISVLR